MPLFAGRERVYGTGMLRAEHPDVAVTFGIHPRAEEVDGMQVTGSAVGTHAVSIRVGEHPIFEQTFRILHGSAVAGIRLHGPYTWGGLFRDNGLVLAELHEADGTPIFGDHGMMWSIGGSRESGRGEVYRYTKKKSGAVTSTLQVSDGTHSAQTRSPSAGGG